MIAAIIQARMGSERLPNKMMADIVGKPLLWHTINRTKAAKKIDKVILATTEREEDQEINHLAKKIGIECFCGSQNDVLDRYYQAAKKYKANVIVRITGDCPLIDPELIDRTIEIFLKEKCHYASLAHLTKEEPISRYPDGLDTEVFSFQALKKAWQEARLPSDREHVTPYIWKNPDIFKCKSLSLKGKKDYSFMRWTVDEKQDLEFVREIYKRLYQKNKIFLMKDILSLLLKEPELLLINSNIPRDEGYFKSLKKDNERKNFF